MSKRFNIQKANQITKEVAIQYLEENGGHIHKNKTNQNGIMIEVSRALTNAGYTSKTKCDYVNYGRYRGIVSEVQKEMYPEQYLEECINHFKFQFGSQATKFMNDPRCTKEVLIKTLTKYNMY